MEGEQTEFIRGVLDMVPDTDFPDIRNKNLIHSNNGSCLLVPREAERIRIYIQIADADVCDPKTGRVDKDRMSPEQLLEVAQKSLYPYSLIQPMELTGGLRISLDSVLLPSILRIIVCSLLETRATPIRPKLDRA